MKNIGVFGEERRFWTRGMCTSCRSNVPDVNTADVQSWRWRFCIAHSPAKHEMFHTLFSAVRKFVPKRLDNFISCNLCTQGKYCSKWNLPWLERKSNSDVTVKAKFSLSTIWKRIEWRCDDTQLFVTSALDGVVSFTLRTLYPGESVPGTSWLGGCVWGGGTTRLDVLAKSLAPDGNRNPDRPTHSLLIIPPMLRFSAHNM